MIASNLPAFRPPSMVVEAPPPTHSTWSFTGFPAPPGDHEIGRPDAFLFEELLLGGHQVLAVDEGRDAVRGRDGLQALRPGRTRPGSRDRQTAGYRGGFQEVPARPGRRSRLLRHGGNSTCRRRGLSTPDWPKDIDT